MNKHVALFEVKAIEGKDPNGEFEAVLSVPVVDRDGEVVDAGAFNPLPAEIPIHKFHDFRAPVATAVPFYDGDVLKARGTFDPDPESQAIRQKVGRSIRYMSVGFMAAERTNRDGVPHITRAELLEASFVSVPANREAAILAVKASAAQTNNVGGGYSITTTTPHAASAGSIAIGGTTSFASAKSVADLWSELAQIKQRLDRLAAPDEGADKTAATDPEEKAADPAAAPAPAGSAADPPAEVPVGHQARVALLRHSAQLAAQVAGKP